MSAAGQTLHAKTDQLRHTRDEWVEGARDVIRRFNDMGWWVFVVYLGIYAVQNGLGDQIGGTVTSVVSLGTFFAPLMLGWMQRHSVRHAVRTGFLMSGLCFVASSLVSPWPWASLFSIHMVFDGTGATAYASLEHARWPRRASA